MSIALTAIEADYRPRLRRRRLWTRIGSIFLSIALLIWTLLPIYNMLLIALSDDGDEFTGLFWPEDWNWDSFRVVFEEDYWYLEHFWHQLGNSFTGQLRVGAHALATRLAGQQHRVADLYTAGSVSADPVRASDAGVRAVRQPVGGGRS
jgi:ABC-type Fe3+ transport system permease subunit